MAQTPPFMKPNSWCQKLFFQTRVCSDGLHQQQSASVWFYSTLDCGVTHHCSFDQFCTQSIAAPTLRSDNVISMYAESISRLIIRRHCSRVARSAVGTINHSLILLLRLIRALSLSLSHSQYAVLGNGLCVVGWGAVWLGCSELAGGGRPSRTVMVRHIGPLMTTDGRPLLQIAAESPRCAPQRGTRLL